MFGLIKQICFHQRYKSGDVLLEEKEFSVALLVKTSLVCMHLYLYNHHHT